MTVSVYDSVNIVELTLCVFFTLQRRSALRHISKRYKRLMAEDINDKEDKFDFTADGEALGYISLAQARLLAMQTARETPGEYGGRFRDSSMAFEIAKSSEDEDYYIVTLVVRPQGDFSGTSGQEQFFISKEGEVAHRQLLSLPGPEAATAAWLRSSPESRYPLCS